MSLASLNYPPLVATAGITALAGLLPLLEGANLSADILKIANLIAFGINVAAVSVPGRIDGQQQQNMSSGSVNPAKPGQKKNGASTFSDVYSASRGRTLVSPAGWAFAIWGPIYLGEAALCAAQFLSSNEYFQAAIPGIAPGFIVANICQSLWCAAFRPSYNQGWSKYVSAAMLGCTGLALSQAHSAVTPETAAFFIPLTMHFGWMSAATLVNINGSLAMDTSKSDQTVIAAGHASALIGTALGMGVTLSQGAPVYGLTLAWALAACASGMREREASSPLQKGMRVQKSLCQLGSVLCAGAAATTFIM